MHAEGKNSLIQKLTRRGFDVMHIDPEKNLLLPPSRNDTIITDYYAHLKKYSFRLFFRDVIRHKDRMVLHDLQKYCSEKTARHYLEMLIAWEMLKPIDTEVYRLIPEDVHSFGDTFEWFIAQVLIREFFSPAAWGIRLRQTNTGGDYDVISSVEGNLLYIEAKSSPPKHVDTTEVAAFLNRVNDLRPHFCIFLEDTRLRMKDKIAEMFQQELTRRKSPAMNAPLSVERLERELFTVSDTIFIINSSPDLITNMRVCIQHFLLSRGMQCPDPVL